MAAPRQVPPALVERFEVISELGRGAMGTVFHARDRATGREFALKLTGRLDAVGLARMQREGEITAALTHPGIVGIHTCGQSEGFPFLAYELVPGARALNVSWGSRDARGRAELIRDAARALGHAHARGVLHRDVKPENVLVDSAGRVRVADFGLATACDLDRLTRTGTIVGTPVYASPEQLAGARAAQGPPTDVWALGVILYEALTDTLPFAGESLLALATSVARDEPPPPRSLAKATPPPLESICLRALRKLPQERYADGDAMADDLDRFLDGEDVAGWAPSMAQRARSLWWVVPLLASLGFVGLALVVPVVGPGPSSKGPLSSKTPTKAPPLEGEVARVPKAPSLAELSSKAQRGERSAMHALGQLFELGSRLHDVKASPRAAQVWYTRAARAGHAEAMLHAGRLAWELNRDEATRVEWVARAATQDASLASYAHGELARHHVREGNLDAAARAIVAASQAGGWLGPAWAEFAKARWPTTRALQGAAAELTETDPLRGLILRETGDQLSAANATNAANTIYHRGFTWGGDLGCLGRLIDQTLEGDANDDAPSLLRTLEVSAVRGSTQGRYVLGVLVLEGRGARKDVSRALELLTKAESYAPAEYRLGLLYRDGAPGITADAERAATLLRSAATRGHVPALRALAHLLVGLRASERFPGELEVRLRQLAASGDELASKVVTVRGGHGDSAARAVFEQASADARGGSFQAMRRVARALRAGEGAPRDTLRALYWQGRAAREEAHSGNARVFGDMLLDELGDESGFVFWLLRAARSPDANAHRAQAWLAEYYWAKGDVERSAEFAEPAADLASNAALVWGHVLRSRGETATATAYYEQAARVGGTPAVIAYAQALWRGDGIRADPATARRLIEEAERNVSDAAARGSLRLALGELLLESKALEDAYQEFLAAAKLGSLPGTIRQADALRDGEGVPADPTHAARLFRRAGEAGAKTAWIKLGKLYERGAGVDVDPLKALECYERALGADTPHARFLHARLLHSGKVGQERVAEGSARMRGLARRGNTAAQLYREKTR